MKQLVVVMVLVACGNVESTDPFCGDNIVEGSEQCDDGNTTPGDGCSSTCAVEPRCGDNTINGTDECDDGNTTGGDGCSATCELECGNGLSDAGEECDDGNTTSFDGCSETCTVEAPYKITASWQLRNVAGTVQACPTGYDTAALFSQPIDGNGTNVGTPIVDLFTCANGSGTTAVLSSGRYKVYLAITNSAGTLIYAQTPTQIIVLDADKSFTASIFTDGGYFSWGWSLIGATTNSALTCAQAGADGVELISTLANSTNAASDIFNCADGSGLTAVLAAGTYTVSIAAIDPNNASLGTAPTLTNKQIMAPNKITDLGTVMIPIDGK
jgi:cysteine-rich repeat protein